MMMVPAFTYHQLQPGLVHRWRMALLNVEVPQTYDGLSAKQFSDIVLAHNIADHTLARARILISLLGITWRTPRLYVAFFFILTEQQRHQLLSLADPFLQVSPMRRTLVTSLRAGRTWLHCICDDLLNELDTKTWGMCDASFLAYQKQRDVAYLRYIAQLLYVPKGTTNEARWKGQGAALAGRLDGHELHLVLTQFAAMRMVLERENREGVFSEGGGAKKPQGKGWNAVMLGLAGEKFGSFKEVERTPIRTFMQQLNINIVQARELLSRMKRK